MNEKAAAEITLEVAATTGMVIAYHAQEAPDRMAVTTYGGNTMNFYRFLIVVMFGAALTLGVFPSVYAQEAVETEAVDTEAAETEEAETEEEALEEFTLAEIVITAERRETSLMDTPVAVSALTADDVFNQALDGIWDLQMRMPGTTFTGFLISMRGVGRSLTNAGTNEAVGLFFDGAYSEFMGRLGDMVDVQRIEAVRGPQSTLYGRNTLAGAINVIFNKPKNEFSGKLQARFGNYDRREFTATLNAPLVGDWLLGRVNLVRNYYGGHIKNVYYDEYYGGVDDSTVYGKLLFQPTDNFSMYLQANHVNWDRKSGSREASVMDTNHEDPLASSGTSPNPAYGYPNQNLGGKAPYTSNVNIVGSWKTPYNNEVTLSTGLDLGNFTLKHSGFYGWWTADSFSDVDGSPNPDAGTRITFAYDYHNTHQELQVLYGSSESRISFLGGLFYYGSTKNVIANLFGEGKYYWFYEYDTTEDPGSDSFAARGGSFGIQHEILEAQSKSAYANLDFQMTDKLNLTIGGRYSIDEKVNYKDYELASRGLSMPGSNSAYQAANNITDPAGQLALLDPASETYRLDRLALGYYLTPSPYDAYGYAAIPSWVTVNDEFEFKQDWDAVMWKVGLDYKWSDSSMVYFGVNRGYKPGGIFIGNFDEPSPYDAEWITSYEGGWKASWLKERMQTALSVYYYDFKDKQMSYTRGYEDDEGEWQTEVLTTNAAGSENYGMELEGTALITQQLKVNLQYSYIHAEYTDFEVWSDNLQKIVNLAGTPMDMAPAHKISLGASYVYPTDFGNFVLHGTYMWQDEILSGIWDDPNAWADPWDRLDAELSWVSPETTWMVILWGKNLTDQAQVWRRTITYVTSTPDPSDYGALTEDVIDPLQFGISITYKW